MKAVHSLILAGGSGTRLWPLSREEMPKQFLTIEGNRSLLQNTVSRMLSLVDPEKLHIVAGRKWDALVAHQAQQVCDFDEDLVIAEPCARNTCGAVALGILYLLDRCDADENDLVLICPSDHVIKDEKAFALAVEKACGAAEEGYLTTFGIVPDHPDTGFGYVQAIREKGAFHVVDRFVEKPDLPTAKKYLEEGCYYWNGGMFAFRIRDMLNAMERHVPEIGEPARNGYEHLLKVFADLPAISLDYAVMEKAEHIAMIPLDAGWSDVGSWDAVYDISKKDSDGNALFGEARTLGGKDNLLFSNGRMLIGVDLEDMLVVDSPDALFVAPKGSSQKVRQIVSSLRSEGRKEAIQAPESARPWGSYKIVCENDRYKIKRIVVNPGKRLSLQYHYHRAEHWTVVSGTALVQQGENKIYLHEGESTFISKNELHRLSNPGKIPLEIIEVQNGEYVGEDDIVRIEDDYRR